MPLFNFPFSKREGYDLSAIHPSLHYYTVNPISCSKHVYCSIVKKEQDNDLKVLKIIDTTDVSDNFIQNFLNSNIILYHPNLVPFSYFYDQKRQYVFVTMDYYQDLSLQNINPLEVFDESGPFEVINEICLGLQFIHENEVKLIHSNIKPSNILITEDNHYLISDQCQNMLKTEESTTLTDYQYYSPEMIKGNEITDKSDMWSFGCVVYYILTGKNAFSGNERTAYDLEVSKCKYEKITNCGVYSEAYNSLIERLLLENPYERHGASEVLYDLDKMATFEQIPSNRTLDYKPETIKTKLILGTISSIIDEYSTVLYDFESIKVMSDNIQCIQTAITSYNYNTQGNTKYFIMLVNLCLNYYDKVGKYIITRIKPNDGIEEKIIKGTANKKINLNKCDVTDNDMFEFSLILKSLKETEILWLSSNRIGDIGAKYLANSLPYVSHLTKLGLYDNYIGDEGMVSLGENIKYLVRLEVLHLYNNEIGNLSMKSLSKSMPFLQNLRDLEIGQNNITAEGILYISSGFQFTPELTKLCIDRNHLGDTGMFYFSKNLQFIPKLETLHLFRCDIGNEGVTVLSDALQYTSNIRDLSLSHNNISDDGLLVLCDIFDCLPNLSVLTLKNNMIDDNGLIILDDSLKLLLQLKKLIIEENKIQSIALCQQLKYHYPETEISF